MEQALKHRRSRAALLDLALDRGGRESLQRQLYGQVREAVLAGRLVPGNAPAVDPDARRRARLFPQHGARRLRTVDRRGLSRVPPRLWNLRQSRPARDLAGAPR